MRNPTDTPIEPTDALSFRDWLNQYTINPRIHGLFQSTIASLLTVNSWELPAAEYFKLVRNIAPLRFGYVEGGSLRLWERMAEFVRSRGGDAVTSSAATAITSQSGRVTGATLRMNGRDVRVEAPIVVSNLGPHATVALAGREPFEQSYLARLDRDVRPTAILWLHFTSDESVLDYSAIAVCTSRQHDRRTLLRLSGRRAAGKVPLYRGGGTARRSRAGRHRCRVQAGLGRSA
jgi:hypothetical protein